MKCLVTFSYGVHFVCASSLADTGCIIGWVGIRRYVNYELFCKSKEGKQKGSWENARMHNKQT